MWGLMAFPSSSTAAGAVPAFRAASRSFCLRNSSRDSFPGPASQIRRKRLPLCELYIPVPEAMMARVKDRLTKPGNASSSNPITCSGHNASWSRSSTIVRYDGHPHWDTTYRYIGHRYNPAAGSAEVFTPSSPSHRYVPALNEHTDRLNGS